MKRSILLFLLAFLITIGAAAAIGFLLLRSGLLTTSPGKDRAPAAALTTDAPAPATTPEPGATPPAPATPAQEQGDTPAPAEPTDSTSPAPAPSSAAPENTPTATPAQPTRKPAKKPRSVEHATALLAAEALRSENPNDALQRQVERGKLTPEAAAVLAEWGKTHQAGKVEEVGSSRRPDGTRVTRYRIVAAEGGEDILLDVVTARNGEVKIETARVVATDKTQLTHGSDALTVAEGFMEAVRRGDMATARRMITGTEVSDATVAGLCMIFEEGAFRLREEAPIRATFENDQHAGFLVYVVSGDNPKPSNIGLEMSRAHDDWRVSAVALDTLLSVYENSASAEGGRYFPIVKNPRGGDSLALFFAFNESTLTPRSLRQLRIVAELLKQSHGKLNISGHTDDVGSEQYNLRLSEKRAEAVKAALVSFGVGAEQITTHGLGKSQPRRAYKPGDTEQQIDYVRGENRRAEIYLDFES